MIYRCLNKFFIARSYENTASSAIEADVLTLCLYESKVTASQLIYLPYFFETFEVIFNGPD